MVYIELANRLLGMAKRASLYLNAIFIYKGPIKMSSRVISVLLTALLSMDIYFTCLATGVKISRSSRAKFTDGFRHSATFACLGFWFPRWVLLAFCSPFSLLNRSTFTTFSISASPAWLHLKRLFRLFNTTSGTSFHDNLLCFVTNIIVEGEEVVKCS